MNHLTDEALSAYLDGASKRRDAEEASRHLASCQPCREALAELAAQDESLRPALAHDPGEAYFERFPGRVEERIRTAGAAGASRGRPAGAFDLGSFFRSPRALAWAGGVAVVVVGGGLALMTGRQVIAPDLRDQDRVTRVERAAPGGAKQAAPSAALHSVDDAGQAPPPAAGPVDQERSRVGAPVLTAEREGVATLGSRDERQAREVPMAKGRVAPAAARSRADAPAPSPADGRQASPGRAIEVRRNEAGEDVPVRRPGQARIAPPAPTAAPQGADRAAQVRKKLLAEPLEAVKQPVAETLDAEKKSAPTQSLGATGVRGDSAAPEYSFAPAPPGPAPEGEARLCGDVRDAADRPIAGAQVVLTDLGRSTTTDARGHFCLSAPRGEHSLSVMAVGYRESRQGVRVESAEAEARVTLAAVSVLEEKGLVRGGRAEETRFSAVPDTLQRVVRDAQRLEADAVARPSAAHYDLAAEAWARALRRPMDGPLEIETRRHLAETRYRAWELGPSSRRARAAVEALTAYAGRAPAGPERDQAARWLNRVRP